MNSRALPLSFLAGALLLGCARSNGSFVCHFGVPGGDEYAITDVVAKHIEKNYAFANRTSVDATHSGKIYYVAPGCVPSFTFYEITDPKDIQTVEELARQALLLAGIDRVSLTFYERQNWTTMSPNWGGSRGHENVVKRVTVEK
jgi:hypothetical protein